MPENDQHNTDPPFDCDVTGCDRPADWAYIGESGDFYVCDDHYLPSDLHFVRTVPDVEPRVRTYDRDGVPHDDVLRTKTGKVITEEDVARWAEEAAEGHPDA